MRPQDFLEALLDVINGFVIGSIVVGFVGLLLGLMYGATQQLFLLGLRMMT